MRTFKMMIVGDKGIGKAQLVPEYDGLHYTDNELNVVESNVKFEILEYGSSFDELIEANIVILVTSIFTMRIEIQEWIKRIRSKCKVGTPILICVSKNDWFVDDGDFDLDLEVMYRSFRLPYLSFVPEVTSVNDNDKREALTKSIELIDKYERRVRKSNHIKINHLDDLCNDIKFCVRSFF